MPYSKLLMKVIAESGYTSKEIVEQCNDRGKKIDRAYLSKLLNNKVPAPSEEVSRIIANICNIDERLLVLEGYIDKAPKEIKEAFDSIKFMTTVAALNIYENKLDEETIKNLEIEMNKEPLADFIISLIDNKASAVNFNENGIEVIDEEENFKLSLTEPVALEIKDDSMFPIISKGSKINLKIEDKYNNGDIVAFKIKGKEDFIIRYVMFNGEDIIFTSLNKEFKVMNFKIDEIIILGRVVKVSTEL